VVDIKYFVDANIKEAIENDLKESSSPFLNGILKAEDDNETLKWIFNGSDGKELASGGMTYTVITKMYFLEAYQGIPINNQIYAQIAFDFEHNGQVWPTDMYVVRGTYTKANMIYEHFRFYQDLTEYYKTKYPDAEIKNVAQAFMCQYYLKGN